MAPDILVGIFIGLIIWFLVRYLAGGIYTVDQNQRGVKTNFARADRIPGATTLNDPISAGLDADEKQRYRYPQVRVIMPGGPYFKWPWQKIYKVSIATQTVNMAFDPDAPGANQSGTIVDAVTKDQLNTGLTGQIRYHISERNLYANIFGVKRPISHVMGYFVSVLRERIATFEAPADPGTPEAGSGGISINDLRKNLRDLNEHMDRECSSSEACYGIVTRRLADYRHRSATGSRVGAGGDQYRAQYGVVRHEPSPGYGGQAHRTIQTRGRDRNPEGRGRSAAARFSGESAVGVKGHG
jgi:hypothetical protein